MFVLLLRVTHIPCPARMKEDAIPITKRRPNQRPPVQPRRRYPATPLDHTLHLDPTITIRDVSRWRLLWDRITLVVLDIVARLIPAVAPVFAVVALVALRLVS